MRKTNLYIKCSTAALVVAVLAGSSGEVFAPSQKAISRIAAQGFNQKPEGRAAQAFKEAALNWVDQVREVLENQSRRSPRETIQKIDHLIQAKHSLDAQHRESIKRISEKHHDFIRDYKGSESWLKRVKDNIERDKAPTDQADGVHHRSRSSSRDSHGSTSTRDSSRSRSRSQSAEQTLGRFAKLSNWIKSWVPGSN